MPDRDETTYTHALSKLRSDYIAKHGKPPAQIRMAWRTISVLEMENRTVREPRSVLRFCDIPIVQDEAIPVGEFAADEPNPVDEAIADAEAFYARRLTAFAHGSYDLQANAPSADAIRAAWRELEERADERNAPETFNP